MPLPSGQGRTRGATRAARYEFRVAERMTPTALAAFPELELSDGPGGTVLFGRVRDDSQLHGILDRCHLLGLTLLEVHRLPD
jgi:hypothetical protein